MEYNFKAIERKWQQYWEEKNIYHVSNYSPKPKYYVLDMFPYPSGAGLHVGHPLGYIASDIFARYKRLKGYNVLHPMGFDAFGLPAEQYAIETGQHPAATTKNNIATFKNQFSKIGFCFDWSREVNTSDPDYYKWTQWIFLQLFNSWYNRKKNKAEHIDELIKIFETEGNKNHTVPDAKFEIRNAEFGMLKGNFSAAQWKAFDEKTKQDILMEYRVAYCGIGEVNWCEALGTVLANDEVINGVSERGGYPVVKKKLRQWYLRITEYADRLLEGLQRIEFSEAMKEMQTNWIGKSLGANIQFTIHHSPFTIEVYTTRPDTIFGVDFMVLAPEHELVEKITTAEQKKLVEDYIAYVNSRSERERMAEKKISGCFTGAYALNPFNGREIPIWISEYVLAGYGTGAIMAVPCGDERDYKFATHFNIPITNIIGEYYNGKEANATKDAVLQNSDFLNGIVMRDASEIVINKLEKMGIGQRKINYKMRDAAFSRQRYWGEPFPIVWKNNIASPLDENQLPLELPYVENYKPGPNGAGPLENITSWINQYADSSKASPAGRLEGNTMPGYAGSSWYFLRYMDPHNDQIFCDRKASDYWNQVDLYIGGTEHAVGHLLYSRMWTKALCDLGYIGFDEPYKKLVNQGMIQGSSRFVYVVNSTKDLSVNEGGTDISTTTQAPPIIISYNYYQAFSKLQLNDQISYLKKYISNWRGYSEFEKTWMLTERSIRVDISIVDGVELNIIEFKKSKPEYADAEFILEGGKYICGTEVEKMSKSKYNVVNPDDIVDKYGADTFRMYEMFLGPVEQSKPWDTKGIEGVHRFLKKLWRLFYDEQKSYIVKNEKPSEKELKILHKTIKKIEEDTERFSFNTAVSQFMICVNELADLKCHKKEILEPLLILLTPYAPHIAEELWHQLGNNVTILDAAFPTYNDQLTKNNVFNYPVAVNGKTRTELAFAADAENAAIEQEVLQNDIIQKWLEGKSPKKIIIVKGRMVNVVV